MERNCLGHHLHIALQTVKSDAHFVETLPYKIFYRWDMVQKAIESVLNHHALADTGTLGSKLKPLRPHFETESYVSSLGSGQRRLDRAPQRIRFARPDILFYDAHRIDLYQLICALYLMA
jgi:hypothetical protein